MTPELFRSAFELNPHAFVLLAGAMTATDTALPSPRGSQCQVLYANPAYRRLMQAHPLSADDDGPADRPPRWLTAHAGARDQHQAGSVGARTWAGFDEQLQRWLHVYMFAVSAPARPSVAAMDGDPGMGPIFGAFVTDPAALITGRHGPTATFGDLVIDYAARTVTLAGRPVDVTRTEYALLDLLSRSPDVALGRQEVLSALWNTEWIGDSSALDVHVSRLRRKLGESGAAPRYIRTVRGHGPMLSSDPDARSVGM